MLISRSASKFLLIVYAWAYCACAGAETMPLRDSILSSHNGIIVIEAERYSSQSASDRRRWITFDKHSETVHSYPDNDPLHVDGASLDSYIEVLPDTRTHHYEALVRGENFSAEPGKMAVLSYPIHFVEPGKYYIWARAFSSGSEDNGVHFGLDTKWPVSSQRLQLCKGKNQWSWSSNQRTQTDHCGVPNTVWVDVGTSGLHYLTVSMREDGFELDKIVLTTNPDYRPSGKGPAETRKLPVPLPQKTGFFEVDEYSVQLEASEHFISSGEAPFYIDHKRAALAIDARQTAYRNIWVSSEFKVPGHLWTKKGERNRTFGDVMLVTLGEIDGESSYRVYHNDTLLGEFSNAETTVDYQENYFSLGQITLEANDILRVEAMAVTNGKIPENGGTAYARGRWRGLVFKQ